MRKLLIILTALTLVISSFFSVGTQNKVKASTENEKNIEIGIISDEPYFKSVELINKSENTSQVLELSTKNGVNAFTTTIIQNDNIVYTNILDVININNDFNTQEWIENIEKQLNGDYESLQTFYERNINFEEKENTFQPRAAFLVFFAIGGLSTAQIATLQTALYATVAVATTVASLAVLNDKISTSTITGPVTSTAESFPKAAEFSGIPTNLTTSGQKHIEAALLVTIASQIKNNSNNTNSSNNLEVYVSSINTSKLKSNVMVVYDIKSNLSGKVNRHLGNTLNGTKVDSSFGDETLNLNGYTVFMIYNHDSKKLFHAHFVPTANRSKELTYQRYRGQFDLKVYPSISSNSTYIEKNNRSEINQQLWEQNYMNARSGRGLLKDSKNNTSVVPYK